MPQQFDDRAYESCAVIGLNDVTLQGAQFGYTPIPDGESICLIEGLTTTVNGDIPNGEWEVVFGTRTGATFTRDRVIDSSNGGAKVPFSGDTAEIALVASSEFYIKITDSVNINTTNIAQNTLDISQNTTDILANASQIAQNVIDIAQNASDINQNTIAIGTKENSLGNPTTDGDALVSTIAGVRSWITLVKNFLNLNDTPNSYPVGSEGYLVKVNATLDGLIFEAGTGASVAWGDITGTLSNQTDLQNALDAKLDTTGTAVDSALLQGQDGAFYLDRTNHSGMQDPNTITFPNDGNVIDLVDLQHFYDHSWSAGITDIDGTVVDGGGCTINIPTIEVVLRTGVFDHSPMIAYQIPAVLGFNIGAGNAGIVYIDYNAGTPIYVFLPAGGKLNLRTEVPLAAVQCDGTNTLVLTLAKYNSDNVGLVERRLVDFGPAHVPGGTILGASGVQNIIITAGLFYYGVHPIADDTFDSSIVDTFTYWYKDGVGGWSSLALQTQISVTQYDDGSGTLANILNNDYSQSWVYMNPSDLGSEVHVLFGDLSVNTEGEISATSPPSELPPILQFLGQLIGRVIVEEAIPTFVDVESAFAAEYKPGGVTAHNTLAGVQGGAFDDYYHVTAAQIQFFNDNPSTDRMRWIGVWAAGTYQKNDVVYDIGWLMIANKITEERAAPHSNGPEFNLYNGTLLNVTDTGRQIIQGIQFIPDKTAYLNGFNIYTYVGSVYSAFIVVDPLGANRIEPVATFTGKYEGWQHFNFPPSILDAGVTIQVLVTVHFIDPTPTTFSGDWDYLTSTNTPAIGQITQGSSGLASLNVHYTDANGGNRITEIQSLVVGDRIIGADRTWVIQKIVNFFTAYAEYTVSPAVQGVAGTHLPFVFEHLSNGIIPYSEEINYWFDNPDDFNTKGLYGLDKAYDEITPDNNAYGVDVFLQYATVSDDWDLLSTSNIDSIGGGEYDHSILNNRELADQHPQAAITGLVADLAAKEPGLGNPTVDGYVLSSLINGTRSWIAAGGGGVNPTQLATAWALIDGISDVFIGTPFNMGTIISDSAGHYSVTFDIPMENTDYIIMVTPSSASAVVTAVSDSAGKTVNGFSFYSFNSAGTPTDCSSVGVQTFGGKN